MAQLLEALPAWARPCCTATVTTEGETRIAEMVSRVGTNEEFVPSDAAAAAGAASASAAVGPPSPATKTARIAPQRELVLEVHSATLHRSFAKVGWMDPYCIISADGREVERTAPDALAHKSPVWEVSHTFASGDIPHRLTFAVWDKNTFHKDVFCGAVTVPIADDMGGMMCQEFTLTKRDLPTGMIKLSIAVAEGGLMRNRTVSSMSINTAESRKMLRAKSIGGEFDHLMALCIEEDDAEKSGRKVRLMEVDHPEHRDDDNHAMPSTEEAKQPVLSRSPTTVAGAAITGSWKCIDTFGLGDFLKATGVGVFQRKIALAAAWPSWDFTLEKDGALKFVNHSAIGDLLEVIPLGRDYQWKDGHKNDLTCRAEWTASSEGGCLAISRKGAIGSYSEERKVTNDMLEFVLTHGSGVKWGRKFKRA